MSAPLSQRSTVADIDLDAIAHDLGVVRDASRKKVIAVVKADAYGHGAEIVSRVLVESGADILAVFTVEEGLVLRAAGIAAPILVFAGATRKEEAADAIAAGLALVVWDLERARWIDEAARAIGRRAVVHFKVDTGLTRLGSPLDEALARFRAVRDLAGLEIEGVFTHYANSDEPDDEFTPVQRKRFAELVRALPERPAFVHAAASAAVALEAAGPSADDVCDAVRPGLALYGLHAAPHLAELDLRPAMRWSSRVQRVADVSKGTGVSYGHAYKLPRDGRIATVPVGYGDGLSRAASGARVLVRGEAVRIVGRVCMDLVMLDVTTDPAVREGDEVVLIGEQDGARVSAEELAAACRTINYEVVTNLRPRVPRRYSRGGRVVATKTLRDGARWC